MGNLTNLTYLWLQGNDLTGSIPPDLGSLTKLTELSLSGNYLTGPIPPELGNLTLLTSLSLSYNDLTGSIPPELGNLTNLTRLYLHANDLTGSIPLELGNLTKLTHLGLHDNALTGSIPPELGKLMELQYLGLGGTQVRGCLPAGLSGVNFSIYGVSIYDPFRPFCMVTLSVTPASVAETSGDTVVTVTASWADSTHVRAGATTIPLSVGGVTATAGSDFGEVADFDIIIGDGAASGTATFTLSVIGDAVYEDAETLSVSGTDATLATYTAAKLTIADDDDPGVTITPAAVTVTEAAGAGRTTSYAVVLNRKPTADVTVTAVSGDVTAATVSPAALTFTASSWATAQTVTVNAVDDDQVDADTGPRTSITHTVASGDPS